MVVVILNALTIYTRVSTMNDPENLTFEADNSTGEMMEVNTQTFTILGIVFAGFFGMVFCIIVLYPGHCCHSSPLKHNMGQ